jgi:hypothetical protein
MQFVKLLYIAVGICAPANLALAAPTFTDLHQYKNGGVDNGIPDTLSPLASDGQGNLYAFVANFGSTPAQVVQLSPPASGTTWTSTVIASFTEGTTFPGSPLLMQATGLGFSIFGVAIPADNSGSVLFALTNTLNQGWLMSQFPVFPAGVLPLFYLQQGPTGDFFGLATNASNATVLYRVALVNGSYKYSTVYTWATYGAVQGPLVIASESLIYGSSFFGGAHGQGYVFALKHASGTWSQTELYSFTGGTDGASPVGGLVIDGVGNLFGTTTGGGNLSVCQNFGCGTLFELSPFGSGGNITWFEQVLHEFPENSSNTSGASGQGLTIVPSTDTLYGLASTANGSGNQANIFKLANNGGGWVYTSLHGLSSPTQLFANGPLLLDGVSGTLYGSFTADTSVVFSLTQH